MSRTIITGSAFGTLLTLLTFVSCRAAEEHNATAVDASPASATESVDPHPSFLYGRITSDSGDTYEGRLRWGRDQEAFWGDYFNGVKSENPWLAHLSDERRSTARRPFMARFGDIARISARGKFAGDVEVTLKSGTVFVLERSAASDFDDGVRVWDSRRGVVDLVTWAGGVPPPSHRRIRTIELLHTASQGTAPSRLHGTVRTGQGHFSGFIQWNRKESVGSDLLNGRAAEGERRLRFDTIRSIERRSRDSAAVTLVDGGQMVLSGSSEIGHGSQGIYVDDERYGRVLISWDAFERVDFSSGGGGPVYSDFPPGRPLRGSVTTRAGRRLVGRLVYDLDESETTETLDAPSSGVDYTIPFSLIASIALGAEHAVLTLRSGEKLQLEHTGDLGAANAGMLIFVEDGKRPEYVAWGDVERIEFDGPSGS